MPRTPDEIKKGLECCLTGNCKGCPYRPLYGVFRCKTERTKDTISYIKQLETALSASQIVHTVDLNDDAVKYIQRLHADLSIEKIKLETAFAKCDQLEAERDAYFAEIHGRCRFCVNSDGVTDDCDNICERCESDCPCKDCDGGNKWQWRGVQKEE